jgi:voltage-gated potassium channel
MILITVGGGIILYGISTITALIVEGDLTGILRKNKMDKQIEKLSGHFIVCGGGETGRPLIAELVNNKEKVVLVEKDEENIRRCRSEMPELPYVQGDATDDHNLIRAGINRAAGIIICLPSDNDNLYITMTSKMLNDNLRIISRMTDPILEAKLKKAGADSVVSPNVIGALRMASEMIRPTAVDFLDTMLRSRKGILRIHEIAVSENCPYIGKQIKDSKLKEKYELLVLGLKRKDDEIQFNPKPNEILESGMKLVIMGEIEKIAEAKKEF